MVNISQLPMKSVMMDVVVADIEPKFGMLLSRYWAKRVGGTHQMDLSYATIPIFVGEQWRLYREVQMAYLVSDSDNPANHPIYAMEEGLGSCMLHLSNADTSGVLQVEKKRPVYHTTKKEDELWKMYFDGSSCKEGPGAGVVLVSSQSENVYLMYKLEFQTTNNVAEYEALVLGLRAAKYLWIQQLAIFGNSKLVVQWVRIIYQIKQQLLKVYRNEVWDLIDNFFTTFNISFIPRDHNQIADSLDLAATFFKAPQNT